MSTASEMPVISFTEIEDLKAEIEELREERDSYRDRLWATQADRDNARRSEHMIAGERDHWFDRFVETRAFIRRQRDATEDEAEKQTYEEILDEMRKGSR